MHNDNTTILLKNFDETAFVFVNQLYTKCCFSIQAVDRLQNENAVQLLIEQYKACLKQNLEGKALEYIFLHKNIPTIDWFQKKLTYMINLHMQGFIQQIRYI